MFTEPQTLTVDAVASNLPRVSFGDRKGVFENTADGYLLSVTHTMGRRNRRVVRFDVTKTAADPLLDGVSKQYSMSVQFHLDAPVIGFDATEQENVADALVAWLGVAGNLTKVINGES